MKKKPIAFFSVSSKEYFKYAVNFWRSMTKFHSSSDIDMILYTNEDNFDNLKYLPGGIQRRDLQPFLEDSKFFFRQKPIIMDQLLDEYEYVVGFDADSIILGNLDYIINMKGADVGTIYNWNRYDTQFYPMVEIMRVGIAPVEYFNCGLVACRNKQFAHNWLVNCFSPQFERCQYGEQDILNIMCYFGNWNVVCFDLPFQEPNAKEITYFGWHGLINKGEVNRAIVKDGEIIVPQGLGDTPFPPRDVKIKVFTLGGGHGAVKDNFTAFFSPEAMARVNEILKP